VRDRMAKNKKSKYAEKIMIRNRFFKKPGRTFQDWVSLREKHVERKNIK